MARELTAKVARTAHDLHHLNHLRLPQSGVTELKLVASNGQKSLSYLHGVEPDPAAGSNDFHFAPDVEEVQVAYRISDSAHQIKQAKLELFRRWDPTPVWTRDLKPEEIIDGAHQWPWKGQVAESGNFPDGYLTVEHSPYKLKLTVAGDGNPIPATAWTYFHVLVADIDLELGPDTVLDNDLDRAVYAQLSGALPAPGETQLLYLVSNLFKTAAAQMTDNTAYHRYRARWGDGPKIPIFAKIWIKDSQDKKVEAPKALGKVKFLWDWEDIPEDTTSQHAAAKTFLDNALDYDKDLTHPKGDNCHMNRGGKRGPGARPVFPPQAGYAPASPLRDNVFPFQVTACPTRTWAAFSYAWTKEALAGKTGVFFQPTRMAGDAFRVRVCLAYEKKEKRPDADAALDVLDDAPLRAAISKAIGGFEIWREVHLTRYIRKTATIAGFDVGIFQRNYRHAFLNIEDNAGDVEEMTEADYNGRLTPNLPVAPALMSFALDPATNHYTAGDYAIHFRSYNAFRDAYATHHGLFTPAGAPDRDAADLALAPGIVNEASYADQADDWAMNLIGRSFDYRSADDGITIIQFAHTSNLVPLANSVTNGWAPTFAPVDQHRCAFVQFRPAADYGADSNTMEQTITHEIGHHLFMPHSPDPAADPPIGNDPESHDDSWHHCAMSYDYTAERLYCGLCLLRLRGWSRFQTNADGTEMAGPVRVLDKTAANNKHP